MLYLNLVVLHHVGNTAREGVQNMHHWSERTRTATENNHSIIAAAIHQWHHLLSPCVKASGHFDHHLVNFILVLLVIFCYRCWRHEHLQGKVASPIRWGG